MKKKVFAILSALFLCFSMTACAVDQSKAVSGSLEYLNKNYEDNFTFQTISLGQVKDKNTLNLEYWSEKYNSRFDVQATSGLFGVKYKDNYHRLCIEDTIEKYFYEIVKNKNYPEVKAYITEDSASEKVDETNVIEWLKTGETPIDIYFFRNGPIDIETAEDVVATLEKMGYTGRVFFVQTDDENCLKNVSLETILANSANYMLDLKEWVFEKGVVIDDWK